MSVLVPQKDPKNQQDPKERIRSLLHDEGFEAVGFTVPSAIGGAGSALHAFLDEGRHGDMAWLKERSKQRAHPQALWPDTRSIVVVGSNYGPPWSREDLLERTNRSTRGNISIYAQGKDYHDVMKKRLKKAARIIHAEFGTQLKLFVDTAPVMEKPLAAAAGLGWQGKHTNLVSPDYGTWLFLGSIFLALDLEPDFPQETQAPFKGHTGACGSCTRCLDICPTGAFSAAGEIDARRCISYLTIEYKGHIPLEFRAPLGNRIYGCDDCHVICPWNKFAVRNEEPGYQPRAELAVPRLGDLASLDDAAFRSVFSGSPVKRIGRDRFVRNVMIAIGNCADAGLLPTAINALDEPSPLVRAMAVWAVRRLGDKAAIAALQEKHLPGETDEDIKTEWTSPLAPNQAAPCADGFLRET